MNVEPSEHFKAGSIKLKYLQNACKTLKTEMKFTFKVHSKTADVNVF